MSSCLSSIIYYCIYISSFETLEWTDRIPPFMFLTWESPNRAVSRCDGQICSFVVSWYATVTSTGPFPAISAAQVSAGLSIWLHLSSALNHNKPVTFPASDSLLSMLAHAAVSNLSAWWFALVFHLYQTETAVQHSRCMPSAKLRGQIFSIQGLI